MMEKPHVPGLVLSRPVAVDTVPAEGLTVVVEASPAEREAMRALNGLVGLDDLRAALAVRREGRDGVRVTGEVVARVARTCVVSLEPFASELREPIDVHFLTPAALERWHAEHAAQPTEDGEGEDEPDGIVNGRIDLGALAAEHLALGLDPYPRKPGVRFEEPAPPNSDDVSPFAALKALRPDNS